MRLWKTGRRSRSARNKPQPRRLICEKLEEKLVMYNIAGQAWENTDVSYSIVPDGTSWNTARGNGQSNLVQTLNSLSSPHQWQTELARSFQNWANHSNLNFHRVDDDGSPSGASNGNQGDIRIAGIAAGSVSGWAYFPGQGIGGDITLRTTSGTLSERYWRFSRFRNLVTHELGHSLGLHHTEVLNSIMGVGSPPDYGLAADDVAGIQALYGAREHDSFDAAGRNDSVAAASSVQFEGTWIEFRADLTSHADIDHYRVTIPASADSMAVSVDARNLSLLAPNVAVYDSQQNLVATASGDYGTVATVNIGGLQAGQTYTIVADGATSDEFGMGAYRLSAQLNGNVGSQPTSPIDIVPPTTNSDDEEPIAPDPPRVVTVPPTPTPTVPIPTTPLPTNPTTPVQTPTQDSPTVVRQPLTIGSLRRLLISRVTDGGSNDNQPDPTSEPTPPVDPPTEDEPTTESIDPTPPTPVTPTVNDDRGTNDQTPTSGPSETPTLSGPPVVTPTTIPVRSAQTIGSLRRLLMVRSVKARSVVSGTLASNHPTATFRGQHSATENTSKEVHAHDHALDHGTDAVTTDVHGTCRPAPATLPYQPRSGAISRSDRVVSDMGPHQRTDIATALPMEHVDHLFSGHGTDHERLRDAA